MEKSSFHIICSLFSSVNPYLLVLERGFVAYTFCTHMLPTPLIWDAYNYVVMATAVQW